MLRRLPAAKLVRSWPLRKKKSLVGLVEGRWLAVANETFKFVVWSGGVALSVEKVSSN